MLPGSQSEPYLPWFAVPGRLHASETLVFGHWASLGTYNEPGVHALDTGCVWGGTLTALCLETWERASVPCHRHCPKEEYMPKLDGLSGVLRQVLVSFPCLEPDDIAVVEAWPGS